MKHLLPLLCVLFVLSGCAAAPAQPGGDTSSAVRPDQLPARFPPAYDLSFSLEAFQGERRSSYSYIRAIRSDDGFYYAASTGEAYLFRRQGSDTYVLYLWDEPAGEMAPSQALSFSEEMLAGFQRSLLHLELLVRDISSLSPAGEGAVAGRPCQIYAGTAPAGAQFSCQETCCIDTATGLALSYTTRYQDQAGRTFTYRLICERFVTEGVELPEAAGVPENKNGNTAGQIPQCSPVPIANSANSPPTAHRCFSAGTGGAALRISALPSVSTRNRASLPWRRTPPLYHSSFCI